MESTSSLGPPSQENLQPASSDGQRPLPVPIPKATLKRTDSALSSSKASLSSHMSVPVTGTFPLGSLRVHQVMDSPRPRQPAERPQAEVSEEMPPLEDDPSGRDSETLDGDVFLILDLPPNSTVGCDARAINTGASGFKGIRDIPPGPHFVWVSEPNAMSRCGYWFVTRDGGHQVRVKQWDKYNEVLAQPASQFELRDHRDNVASLYPQLVSPQLVSFKHGAGSPAAVAPATGAAKAGGEDGPQLWRQLTSGISEVLLGRVTGNRGAGEWLVDTSDSAQGEASFPHTTQLYKAVVGGSRELHFLFPDGDVDLTALAGTAPEGGPPDTTAEVLRLLGDDNPGGMGAGAGGAAVTEADLLGELQLTFLAGLHLSNLSCVDQWWHLVLRVVLRAHRLVLVRPRLATALLHTLHAQLVYDERYIAGAGDSEPAAELLRRGGAAAAVDGDVQGTSVLDIVPGNRRKLRRALALYKRRLDDMLLGVPPERATAEQAAMGEAFGELEVWFWKLGWDLRTDPVGGEAVVAKGAAGKGRGNIASYNDDDDDDNDDYQPVIVDLDANGREVGLVSFS
ncbi:hypothetical protein Daus18300_004795 [Diaporthe australafricana]|uniref:Uncharacterized protein n=1 Tax=Diaporthe australafricana TaxID=127596 RepID=A0ABR3X694_9PEZI